MKISMEWLREYVDVHESPEKLQGDLSMAGLLVESVADCNGTTVLEVEVTSNRPDCLSHIGVAREVAALYRRPLKTPTVRRSLHIPEEKIPYSVEIKDPDLCPRYTGLVVDGLRVEPSPDWLGLRLEAAGMRPVNNIVDITNYVLLEMGHPLHAFDFERLRDGKIVVGRAHPGEYIQTLDGVGRELDGEMLLINDGKGPVAIAGVMGGANSEISQSTRAVLLECAYFQPASVRRTSKKLGLSTEASYRFERGADWERTVPAIARTCYLMEKLAGGRIAGSLQDAYPARIDPVQIPLRRDRAEALLGIDLTDEFILGTLKRLNFKLTRKGKGFWLVTCPTWRADMELEADLIEELARFHGYQNIPTTRPPFRGAGCHSPAYEFETVVRGMLRGLGYSEVVNLSFAGEAEHHRFPPFDEGDRVTIRNPLTEDTEYLRTTLAPGLAKCARRNFNFDQRQIRLFEIGKIYRKRREEPPRESNSLGILGSGGIAGRNWHNPSDHYDFFHMKGTVTTLLQGLRTEPFEIAPDPGIAWLNPANASRIVLAGKRIGVLGQLHPELEEHYKFRQPVFLAELDCEELSRHTFRAVQYEPLPRYPSVERDMSVVVDSDVSYGTVKRGILALGIPELISIELIDVYEGEKVPEGKLSITLRFTFQDREKTLTIDRVQGFSDNVLSYLRNTCGAELR
jgi:phenylalanyl-tRNA synthetase beta chain